MTFVRAMLLAITPLAWCTAAQAGLVTYYYTGTVNFATDIVQANSSIQLGDAVTGSFTLDTDVPDTTGTTWLGDYQGFVSGTTTIGGLTFTSTGGIYSVLDQAHNPNSGDRVNLSSSNVDVTGADLTSFLEGFNQFRLAFQPSSSDLVTSDALPDLLDFFEGSGPGDVVGGMSFATSGVPRPLSFIVDSLSLDEPAANAVPEPGSLALVGLSLVGLAASRRAAARVLPGGGMQLAS